MSSLDILRQRLCQAFGNFERIAITITDGEVNIIDYKNDGCIVTKMPNEGKSFIISNIQKIVFVPIDGRQGLIGFGSSQCDFVFFDEVDFCFVEFKLNATSTELRAIEKNRLKAVEQILATIKTFDEKLSNNYNGLNLEGYVCTPNFYPKENTSWQSLSRDFLETYGIPLFEINHKICK